MDRSIIIVGAGIGGLASGVYGRLNSYRTTIFEQHSLPGGQCCSWKRKGYTFDGCIHHLFGCDPGSRFYGLWRELGAMPRDLARTRDCVSVASPDDRLFMDYYDTAELERHLRELSPHDSAVIEQYARATMRFAKTDFFAEAMMGSRAGLVAMTPPTPEAVKMVPPDHAAVRRQVHRPIP